MDIYLLCRFMEASYRRSLIAQEVLGYNADIVCLQEVDEKAFFTYFLPVMQHAGAPFPSSLHNAERSRSSNFTPWCRGVISTVDDMERPQDAALQKVSICTEQWLRGMELCGLSAR